MLIISNEAKALQGPWTTLVKGRGLGATVRAFNAREARHIKTIFDCIENKLSFNDAYTEFSRELTFFILDYSNPEQLFFQRKDLYPRIDHIINRLQALPSDHDRICATAVLFETIGKLHLDPRLVCNPRTDLVTQALESLQRLPLNNSGQRYDALQAYGNLFLGVAHLGMTGRLDNAHTDYIEQAFDVLAPMEDIWYRGRAAAAFFTVLGMIGKGDRVYQDNGKHIRALLVFLSDSLQNEAAVRLAPNKYVFAILLTINALAVLGQPQYLEYQRDWITVSETLINRLPGDLKLIFTHYLMSALQNLGHLETRFGDIQQRLSTLIQVFMEEPETELSYMGYTYFIDLAHRLDATGTIPAHLPERLIASICREYNARTGEMPNSMLYGSGFMRIAYAVMALGALNSTSLLLTAPPKKGGHKLDDIIQNHIDNWEEDYTSLPFLCHALLDLALSQRGSRRAHTNIDNHFFSRPHDYSHRFADLSNISRPDVSSLSAHLYFTGMNSRRSYVNLPRDIADHPETKLMLIRAARMLGYVSPVGDPDIAPFFMAESHFPDNLVDKWNYIGAATTVYNLALFTHLTKTTPTLGIHSVGGESFGMIAAAIAAQALTLEDGLKIASNMLGIIYAYTHANIAEQWAIVSLRGAFVSDVLADIQAHFPHDVDVFRWQSVHSQQQEVHAYIRKTVLADIQAMVQRQYPENTTLKEFKKPTIEILHSPKLAPVRVTLNEFLIDNNITFSIPKIPIVANNGIGLAITPEDVRSLILDMVNIPMYTAQSFDALSRLDDDILDFIIEIGCGEKTRPFIEQHNIATNFVEYFGDRQRLSSLAEKLQQPRHSNNSGHNMDKPPFAEPALEMQTPI